MTRLSSNRESAGTAISMKRAGGGDHDTLSALHGACFSNAWPAQEFTNLMALSNTSAFLARTKDEAGVQCGFIVLRHAADEAEIITLGVVPSARRRGVASAMLAHTVASLKAEGVAVLFLEVAEDNVAALGLYRTHGFCEVGRRDAYYSSAAGTPCAAIVMRRAFNGSD